MASLADEIYNCGFSLEQRRRHIFCDRKTILAVAPQMP